MADYIYAIILILAIVFAGFWLVGYVWGYDTGEKQAQENVNEFFDKNTSKKIAGHKAAFTKTKKHYEIAKKIIRRGREE